MDFEQQLLERVEALLHGDGITHVSRTEKLVTAWVTELVEGKDFKVPLGIYFVPCERSSDGERQLQICFTLSQHVQMEKYRQLVDRLGTANARTDIGTLSLFPNGEICYIYQMLLFEGAVQAAIQTVQEALQMMLMFLFEYYLYILVLSADPEKMTLEQYQASGYGQTDNTWQRTFIQDELKKLLTQCLQTECDRIEDTAHGLAFQVSQISENDQWKAVGVVSFLEEHVDDESKKGLMQLELTVLDDISPENLEEMKVRMHDLSKQTTFGWLAVNDRRQLVYRYACPVTGYGAEQIVQLFTSIAYEMLTFLDIYYPYLIVCAADTDKMTWSEYIGQLAEQV